MVQIARGLIEDDGTRLLFGAALLLAGPELVQIVARKLVDAGIVRPPDKRK